VSGPNAVAVAALGRASQLLEVLDREHTNAEMHLHARAVRLEVQAALAALGGQPPGVTRGEPRLVEQMTMEFGPHPV
jgi:hypothetical protein